MVVQMMSDGEIIFDANFDDLVLAFLFDENKFQIHPFENAAVTDLNVSI